MIIKWIAEYYIKQACRKACDADCRDYDNINIVMFNAVNKYDTESNDSTLYAVMLSRFNLASRVVLLHVSKGLRK